MDKAIQELSPFFYNEGEPLFIPISYLCPPPIEWRVRGLDEGHVKSLVESFKNNKRTIAFGEAGGCLIVDETLSKKNSEGNLEITELLDYMSQHACPVFSGNHRRAALTI